ncbi:alpha/beta hydrolase [Sphingomonas sp. KR3-1]|uniref:alpha/beta hydrolase n=1 Tax=Sphingomonas sp. KR3-1 TaxID=3156611 RepID=UPI0032B382FA
MRKMFAALLALALAGLAPIPAQAQQDASAPRTRFVHLANGVPGVLYEPAVIGPRAGTAVFIMHSSADYLGFPGCTELAKRGYRVLCANNSTSKSGVSNDGVLDQVLLEIKAGVSWLRSQPGITRVVLLGHSGGGTIMSAYQYIAERGVKACQAPEKIWKCPDSLAGLPAADGLMLVDSNWGLAAMTLFSIDPAITDEASGIALDPALDMYNAANGFAPTGSRYPAAFVTRFLKAEGARNNRLLAKAQALLAKIEVGQGPYADDAPFVVPGAVLFGSNNKLFSQDVGLLAHTAKPWPLIHADGSVTTGIVPTVRVPENVRSPSPSLIKGALKTTVRNYLNNYAIRTGPDFGYDEQGVHGVDWTSTYASPPGNVQGVSAPLLVLGMTGHWEYLAAEEIYGRAASKDKSIAFIEGATHGYTTCTKCEPKPGAYGDTQKTTYDTIDAWLAKPGRFTR